MVDRTEIDIVVMARLLEETGLSEAEVRWVIGEVLSRQVDRQREGRDQSQHGRTAA
jgi:hypothetical protein